MEDAIVACGERAAPAFASRHGAAAALVLDTDPPAGYVLFSFETATDLVASLVGHSREEATRRAKALAGKQAWKQVAAYAGSILGAAVNPGDFQHMDFDRVDFGETMARFDRSDACPEARYGAEGYVRARFRLALTRAVDRLVASRALDVVVGEAPLLVGYTFHEEPTVVLQVLPPARPSARGKPARRTRLIGRSKKRPSGKSTRLRRR